MCRDLHPPDTRGMKAPDHQDLRWRVRRVDPPGARGLTPTYFPITLPRFGVRRGATSPGSHQKPAPLS